MAHNTVRRHTVQKRLFVFSHWFNIRGSSRPQELQWRADGVQYVPRSMLHPIPSAPSRYSDIPAPAATFRRRLRHITHAPASQLKLQSDVTAHFPFLLFSIGTLESDLSSAAWQNLCRSAPFMSRCSPRRQPSYGGRLSPVPTDQAGHGLREAVLPRAGSSDRQQARTERSTAVVTWKRGAQDLHSKMRAASTRAHVCHK